MKLDNDDEMCKPSSLAENWGDPEMKTQLSSNNNVEKYASILYGTSINII